MDILFSRLTDSVYGDRFGNFRYNREFGIQITTFHSILNSNFGEIPNPKRHTILLKPLSCPYFLKARNKKKINGTEWDTMIIIIIKYGLFTLYYFFSLSFLSELNQRVNM